jgi:hypothetical protein
MKLISKPVHFLLLCAAFLALIPALYGCSGSKAAAVESGGFPPAIGNSRGRLLVILLDETSSFSGQWSAAVLKASQAIRELYPGDALIVLGVDNRSWGSDDIRVPYTTLSNSTLRAVQEKAHLIDQTSKLQQRPTSSGFMVNGKPKGTPAGTDLFGSLDFASKLVENAGDKAVSIALFSDMEDEAPKDGSARRSPMPFPKFTHMTVLGVRAHSGDEVQKRIEGWVSRVNEMAPPGSAPICSSKDFHLIGQSNEVSSFFGWTRH